MIFSIFCQFCPAISIAGIEDHVGIFWMISRAEDGPSEVSVVDDRLSGHTDRKVPGCPGQSLRRLCQLQESFGGWDKLVVKLYDRL